ncbi:MAG: YjjG family noncanonical pyrimidine nucleotidase [Rikenellaceae bacterium]
MKQYKHIFCDWDDTFWDVKSNQRCAIEKLYETNSMDKYFESVDQFFNTFIEINSDLWLKYRDGIVKREELRNRRFTDLLFSVGIVDEDLAISMSDEYLRITPRFNALFPYSKEILEYLVKEKGYKITLITNGFNEVQFEKIRYAGLSEYFERVITSEFAGVNKPAPGIFEYAMRKAGVRANEAIMIGDDPYNDIIGAKGVGLDTIYFNFKGAENDLNPTYEINCLNEIKNIL